MGALLPGPLARLLRAPLGAAFVAVLVVLVIIAAQVRDASRVTLLGAIDRDWRGAYDILVRPAGASLDLERTDGLVEPNFLSFTGRGGISEAQLAAIRSLDRVDLAAPVAVVGYIRYSFSAPSVFTSTLPSKPTLYRLTLTATTSDGLTERLVQKRVSRLLLGPADLAGTTVPFASDERALSFGEDGVSVAFPELPGLLSPLVAVDPIAERQLLGSTSNFLNPLIELQGPDRAGLSVAAFDIARVPADMPSARFTIRLLRSQSDASGRRPIVPIVVSERMYAPLWLRLRVEQIGDPLTAWPTADAQRARLAQAEVGAGAGATSVGEVELDLSSILRPYDSPSMTVLWPGSERPNGTEIGTRVDQEFVARLGARPSYERSPGTTAFVVAPLGLVDPGGLDEPSAGTTGIVRGAEQAYRRFESVALDVAKGFVALNPFDRPFVLAPVGSFDLDELDVPDDTPSYVPYGAYDPPATTARRDGGRVPLSPTLNAAGFIQVPPLALTDLAGGELLRGAASIDAVRVRVAGIDGFDEAARRTVAEVAAEIADLGLDVTVVAGSSPQDVDLVVPAYETAVVPPIDLRDVSQPWVTLGAAQRVERALGAVDAILLGLVFAFEISFVLMAEGLFASVRRREVAILRSIGWRRSRLVRWYGSEMLLLGILVVPAAWLAAGSGERPIGLAAALCVLVVALLARSRSLLGLRASQPDGAVPPWGAASPTVTGPVSLGVRIALGRVPRAAAVILTFAAAGTALALGIVVLATALDAAGPTRLAQVVSAHLRGYQALSIGLLAAGSVALNGLLVRIDLEDRRRELAALSRAGWSPRRISLSLVVQYAIWTAAGTAVGLLASTGLVLALGGSVVHAILGIVLAIGGAFSSAALQARGAAAAAGAPT